MSEAEFLFVGDIHFDKLKKLFPKKHIDLQLDELRKPYYYAKKNGIKNIIQCGDVGEFPRLSYEAFIGLLRFLKKETHVHTHFILGNHDYAEDGVHSLQQFIAMQELDMLPNVSFYSSPYIEKFSKVKVNFSPYPFIESVENAVNVGHFEVSGSTRDNGHKIKKAVDVNERDHWVMGHLHTPHDVANTHYCGNLYQLNFGESLPKSFTHARYRMKNGRLEKKLKRINNDPAFKFFNVPVNDARDLKVIEKNPLYLYKLFIHSSFNVTEDMLSKFANVVDIKGFESKQELKALIEEEFIEINEQSMKLPSLTENLKSFMKEKGASKAQRKRGIKLISDMLKEGKDERPA